MANPAPDVVPDDGHGPVEYGRQHQPNDGEQQQGGEQVDQGGGLSVKQACVQKKGN